MVPSRLLERRQQLQRSRAGQPTQVIPSLMVDLSRLPALRLAKTNAKQLQRRASKAATDAVVVITASSVSIFESLIDRVSECFAGFRQLFYNLWEDLARSDDADENLRW
jgi:hypothetical protein